LMDVVADSHRKAELFSFFGNFSWWYTVFCDLMGYTIHQLSLWRVVNKQVKISNFVVKCY